MSVPGSLTALAMAVQATLGGGGSGGITALGGTITYDGLYTVHTFTGGTADRLEVLSGSGNVQYLVVGGGGGGGNSIGGGGGGGGVKTNGAYDYPIAVGFYEVYAGVGGGALSNGAPSYFDTIYSSGGGRGGNYGGPQDGAAGASGGQSFTAR